MAITSVGEDKIKNNVAEYIYNNYVQIEINGNVKSTDNEQYNNKTIVKNDDYYSFTGDLTITSVKVYDSVSDVVYEDDNTYEIGDVSGENLTFTLIFVVSDIKEVD